LFLIVNYYKVNILKIIDIKKLFHTFFENNSEPTGIIQDFLMPYIFSLRARATAVSLMPRHQESQFAPRTGHKKRGTEVPLLN